MIVAPMKVYAIYAEGKGYISYKPYEYTYTLEEAKFYHTLGRAKAVANGLALHDNVKIHAVGLSPMGVVYERNKKTCFT